MNINDIKYRIQDLLDNPDTLENPGAFMSKLQGVNADLLYIRHGITSQAKLEEYNQGMADIQSLISKRLVEFSKEYGIDPETFVEIASNPKNLSKETAEVFESYKNIGEKNSKPQSPIKASKRLKSRNKMAWAAV